MEVSTTRQILDRLGPDFWVKRMSTDVYFYHNTRVRHVAEFDSVSDFFITRDERLTKLVDAEPKIPGLKVRLTATEGGTIVNWAKVDKAAAKLNRPPRYYVLDFYFACLGIAIAVNLINLIPGGWDIINDFVRSICGNFLR